MELGVGSSRRAALGARSTALILLDTNAVIWLHSGHRRARPLVRTRGRLYVSPVSLLEIQFLLELGRLRLRSGGSVEELAEDERWLLDEPSSSRWFLKAVGESWTRDPFDRLVVAHARLRGWRIATGDREVVRHYGPASCMEL